MLNITQIPAPRVELIDPRTGLMSREWFIFFNNIYTIVGANLGVVQINNGGTGLGTLPTNGQLLIGDAINGYVLNTLNPADGITITNGAGTITLTNTGVLSFSAGTTGLTPNTATTGNVVIGGLLNVSSGGTGQSTFADGELLIGNTIDNTLAKSTLTAGVGVSITNGSGSITIANTAPMIYPAAGIPNSTGTAWGTSYGVTGTGSVVLNTLPTMSVTGSGFTLQDITDNTKQANFDLSALTTATSYTYNLPTITGALATLGNITQTFAGVSTFSNTMTLNGSFTVNTPSTSLINIGGTSQTGALSIGRSTLGQTLTLGNNATGTSTINIGRTSATLTINMAYGANSSSTKTINIGTGSTGGATNITIGEPTYASTTLIQGVLNQTVYTVATLPATTSGARSFVSDALAPAMGVPVVGGGAVSIPVYYNGTNWLPDAVTSGTVYTSNYIPYGQGTTTLNQSTNLQFDGTTLTTTGITTGTTKVSTGYLYNSFNTTGTTYPAINTGGAQAWNFSSGSGEVNYWNTFTTATTSFNWRQQTNASTSTVLLTLSPIGTLTSISAMVGTALIPTGSALPGSGNGIYLPSANSLGFATASTNRLTIDATGNLAVKGGTVTVNNNTLNVFSTTGGAVVSPSLVFGSAALTSAASIYSKTDSATAGNLVFATSDATSGVITERVRISSTGGVSIGNTVDKGTGSLNVSGLIYPQQATTAGAPAYVKGAIYFDTTLNKLRVGGATAWETITSV